MGSDGVGPGTKFTLLLVASAAAPAFALLRCPPFHCCGGLSTGRRTSSWRRECAPPPTLVAAFATASTSLTTDGGAGAAAVSNAEIEKPPSQFFPFAKQRLAASSESTSRSSTPRGLILLHWKGEHLQEYSAKLRTVEFEGALSAIVVADEASDNNIENDDDNIDDEHSFLRWNHNRQRRPPLKYVDALRGDEVVGASGEHNNDDPPPPASRSEALHDSALQYLFFLGDDDDENDGGDDGGGDDDDRARKMQYWRKRITVDAVSKATERCALLHAAYLVTAVGTTYDELVEEATTNGSFDDLITTGSPTGGGSGGGGGSNDDDSAAMMTWCVRLRQYGRVKGSIKGGGAAEGGTSTEEDREDGETKRRPPPVQKRYGVRTTRSVSGEKDALKQLKPLLIKFNGAVDLQRPDCKIYVLDGLRRRIASSTVADISSKRIGEKEGHTSRGEEEELSEGSCMVLARRVAVGPKTSIMAPKTRICKTTTPLCPLAAYALCNAASIRSDQRLLDPYGGSCATLLAASLIEPNVVSVSIEIASDWAVNRTDIVQDFASRRASPPAALIQGDATRREVRDLARKAIGGGPFDVILTDPPYGIREKRSTSSADGATGDCAADISSSSSSSSSSPLGDLFAAIADDRQRKSRLLKKGGMLVAFVPCSPGVALETNLPGASLCDNAGLILQRKAEQRLNDLLSRWLVVYECLR